MNLVDIRKRCEDVVRFAKNCPHYSLDYARSMVDTVAWEVDGKIGELEKEAVTNAEEKEKIDCLLKRLWLLADILVDSVYFLNEKEKQSVERFRKKMGWEVK